MTKNAGKKSIKILVHSYVKVTVFHFNFKKSEVKLWISSANSKIQNYISHLKQFTKGLREICDLGLIFRSPHFIILSFRGRVNGDKSAILYAKQFFKN